MLAPFELELQFVANISHLVLLPLIVSIFHKMKPEDSLNWIILIQDYASDATWRSGVNCLIMVTSGTTSSEEAVSPLKNNMERDTTIIVDI